jgi:hypothetical protein
MRCPRCRGEARSEAWCPIVWCTHCGVRWSFEEYAQEKKTLRLVWIIEKDKMYLRLVDRMWLNHLDNTVEIDGKKYQWKAY